MGAPVPGQVYVGRNGKQYRYNGGDPNSQASYTLEPMRSQGFAEDRRAQNDARVDADAARRQADLALQFLQINNRTGTTGLQNLLVDDGPVGAVAKTVAPYIGLSRHLNDMTAMKAINASMFTAGLKPGQATMANTPQEAARLSSTYPSVNNPGPTNDMLAAQMVMRAKVAEQRTAAMDAYLRTHGTLSGFDEAWAPQERAIYQQGSGLKPIRRGAFGRGLQRRAMSGGDDVIDLDQQRR